MSEGEEILAAAAAEAGLPPAASPAAAAAAPGAQAAAAAPVRLNPAIVAKMLPAIESTLAAAGGAHWRLTEEERQSWCELLCVAYPELDPGRFAKPLFWLVTLAIFGPRLALTVKIVMKGMKDGRQPAPHAVQERKPGGAGEAGERKDDARPQSL